MNRDEVRREPIPFVDDHQVCDQQIEKLIRRGNALVAAIEAHEGGDPGCSDPVFRSAVRDWTVAVALALPRFDG